ncbi:MAG TPA: dTMP kinase [Clostridia bacterium]|nr:dTMP kinase [Clostridia bacterium]
MTGYFITLEGIDGSGKTTHLGFLKEMLSSIGFRVVLTREPGGTALGEKIREILLDPSTRGMDPMTEVLLYNAARSQLVKEVIQPALQRGLVVLSERFADSTIAYQGYGLGLPVDIVRSVNGVACNGVYPDLTLLFDLDVEIARARILKKVPDRVECRDVDYYRRVREGYLTIAGEETHRVKIIDASQAIEEVRRRATQAVLDFVRVHSPSRSKERDDSPSS